VEHVEKLIEKRDAITNEVRDMTRRAAEEDRDLTEDQMAYIDTLDERAAKLDRQLKEHQKILESQRSYAELLGKLEVSREKTPATRATSRQSLEVTSWGEQFTGSDQFRSYNGRGQSGTVELADFLPHQSRAAITTADLAIPSYVLPPRVQDVIMPPLLQVVDVVGVSSGTVEWVVVSGDPKAQVVAEGLAKPEAALTFTPQSATLDTLAHWVQITRQALEDATYIRSVIEGKLRRGVTLAIVDQIQAAITAATLPVATVPVGGNLLDAIRVGIGTVQSNGYNPNAVILNPADWAALDISVMGGTLNGPTVGTNFWGLTPIASTLQAAGTALVGDFKSGVTWFDRNVSSVFMTDSHGDLFIRNTLVILAETRGKAAVPEPLALCECSVSATAGTAAARKS